jgi:hypothetical protein
LSTMAHCRYMVERCILSKGKYVGSSKILEATWNGLRFPIPIPRFTTQSEE